PNHAALALPDAAVLAAVASGKCAGCGAEVLADVRVCFRCGLVPVVLEPGNHCVLVLGPGRISDKLDSDRRDRLVQWLRANEKVGFGVEVLEHEIPRLPFVLVRGVGAITSTTIIGSLERLGIEATAVVGSPLAHPAMRKHVWRMATRGFTLVAAILAAPAMLYGPIAFLVLPFIGLAFGVVYAVARRSAARTTVSSLPTSRPALPPGLQGRIAQLPALVPTIAQRRHREALGTVVGRVLALLRGGTGDAAREISAELEHAINLAAVAVRRMDDIESMMTRRDFDPADADHRAVMQERDMWAARLLDLTATLDALAARLAAAQARVGVQRSDDALASLRANVEALEEVQRL
ncbi:MAG: hypothetical protein IAG13_08030, partial [Deltaproteobacteria bacterium]|nr:hypothetical protein [Nannocystaceae bacterium]